MCVILRAYGQSYAVFQTESLSVKETAGLVGIPLSREGGSQGLLEARRLRRLEQREATVSIDSAASSISAGRYNFVASTLRRNSESFNRRGESSGG